MADLVAAARKVAAAEKLDAKARAKLAKAKANKKTRKTTLATLQAKAEAARLELDRAREKLVVAAGARAENPTSPAAEPDSPPAPGAVTVDEGAAEHFIAVINAELDVVISAWNRVVELTAREDNPFVPSYRRSPRVRPHERGLPDGGETHIHGYRRSPTVEGHDRSEPGSGRQRRNLR